MLKAILIDKNKDPAKWSRISGYSTCMRWLYKEFHSFFNIWKRIYI